MSSFSKDDKGIVSIEMAVAAAQATNKILEKYGKITPKLPLSVPHILVHGAAGCGKTTRINEAANLMGCSEEDGTYIKVSGETVKSIEDLVNTLNSKLSWQGYLCNHGKTDHCNCPKENHKIVDPINPKSPVKPQIVFFDEIHVLSKDLQEKLGLIILDFRYELLTRAGLKTIFFPKFTFAAATTKPGDLIKPLRTRFGLKIAVTMLSEEEMISVVKSMVDERGWAVEPEVVEIIAKMSQGTPREAGNHLTGLFGCWRYCLNTGQDYNKQVISKEIAVRYADTQGYTIEGISYDQVRILKYLAGFASPDLTKVKGVGVGRICGALNLDAERFADELEPHLVHKGYISSGGRGREITEAGFKYVSAINL